MIPVILESPYSGEVGRNKLYLQACIRDCIQRGESPYASHQMLTKALDDRNPQERLLGIDAARPWYTNAHKQVVYTDFGISSGMQHGIATFAAVHDKRPITEYRVLGGVWAAWVQLEKQEAFLAQVPR